MTTARFSEIECLRGLAISLVVVHHAVGLVNGNQPPTWTLPRPAEAVVLGGHTGVSLFFVLSGFLVRTEGRKHHPPGSLRLASRPASGVDATGGRGNGRAGAVRGFGGCALVRGHRAARDAAPALRRELSAHRQRSRAVRLSR